MLQNQIPIQKKQGNIKTTINQKTKKSTEQQQQIKSIQQDKQKIKKPFLQQYFKKPVIYKIILFLNFKEISKLRQVNHYFNQTFIECLPILKQYYNEQFHINQQLLQSNIFYNQFPQINVVDVDEFKSGLQNEFIFACPEKVPKQYINCIELISKVLLSELPKWRYSKYTYQMKTKLLYEQLQQINVYDLTDKQVDIIRQEALNIDMNNFTQMKCVFCPLIDFVDNLIIVTRSEQYKELKKFQQIQIRINEIQKFLNTCFKNE